MPFLVKLSDTVADKKPQYISKSAASHVQVIYRETDRNWNLHFNFNFGDQEERLPVIETPINPDFPLSKMIKRLNETLTNDKLVEVVPDCLAIRLSLVPNVTCLDTGSTKGKAWISIDTSQCAIGFNFISTKGTGEIAAKLEALYEEAFVLTQMLMLKELSEMKLRQKKK
jgi:hypothetical protein